MRPRALATRRAAGALALALGVAGCATPAPPPAQGHLRPLPPPSVVEAIGFDQAMHLAAGYAASTQLQLVPATAERRGGRWWVRLVARDGTPTAAELELDAVTGALLQLRTHPDAPAP